MKEGIAIAGNLLVDKINQIDTYPNISQLVKINDISFAVGGCVPNVSIGLKILDKTLPVYAIGRIGCDNEGDFLINQLSFHNVDTRFITKGKGKTSFTDVMSVKGGERTFFTFGGENDNFSINDFDFDNLNAKMLHLGYFLLLDKIDNGEGELVLKRAKDKGIMTSIDLVSSKNGDYSKVIPCLKYTDNLIINELEGGALCGIEPKRENLLMICKKLKSLGVKQRVIIHSKDVSVCLGNEFSYLPSLSLPSNYIKGSTGAGDAFCSGCLWAIYNNLSDEQILTIGSQFAVMALREEDSISGLTDLATTRNFTQQFRRKNICL